MLLFDSELERACERGSVRDRGVDVGSIDSREPERKGGWRRLRSLRDSLRRLLFTPDWGRDRE